MTDIEYLAGRAPVQGEGTVGEKRFYFRARTMNGRSRLATIR